MEKLIIDDEMLYMRAIKKTPIEIILRDLLSLKSILLSCLSKKNVHNLFFSKTQTSEKDKIKKGEKIWPRLLINTINPFLLPPSSGFLFTQDDFKKMAVVYHGHSTLDFDGEIIVSFDSINEIFDIRKNIKDCSFYIIHKGEDLNLKDILKNNISFEQISIMKCEDEEIIVLNGRGKII